MKEEILNDKAETIFKLQRKIDKLLDEIYEENEEYGHEVCEVLREELYKDKENF
jgi:hypothetical protein